MKPKRTPQDQNQDAFELFRSNLNQLIDPDHPLIILADWIDWSAFEKAFSDCFCEDTGAPAKAIRLMVGLHYLKHNFNESDESVVARWTENPYWQYFCGETHFQHECPIHPTTMTKWRQRVGEQRLNELLVQTIEVAKKKKFVSKRELQQVTADTTVEEKNITHPTDSKLLYQAILKLGKAAKDRGIKLRQPYCLIGKKRATKAGRYAHARQFRRMNREIGKLRTYTGRMIRDIERKASPDMMDEELKVLLANCLRICNQKRTDSKKLYSLHEPEVCCISKGKAHKRYEFGQKVAMAVTNRGNWFTAALLLPNNPYDGHTLAETLAKVEANTGVALTDVYVDKGYRGHDYEGDATVHLAGSKTKSLSRSKMTRSERKRRKRRSAIEPKIGHAKSDHRMGRCYLKGLEGDAINAILAAAASNFRKLYQLAASCADLIVILAGVQPGWGVVMQISRKFAERLAERFDQKPTHPQIAA